MNERRLRTQVITCIYGLLINQLRLFFISWCFYVFRAKLQEKLLGNIISMGLEEAPNRGRQLLQKKYSLRWALNEKIRYTHISKTK